MKFSDAQPEQQSHRQRQRDDFVLPDDADEMEVEAADLNPSRVKDTRSVNEESKAETEELQGMAAENVLAVNDENPENCLDNQKAASLHFETAENGTSEEIIELLDMQQLEQIRAMAPTATAISEKFWDSSICSISTGNEPQFREAITRQSKSIQTNRLIERSRHRCHQAVFAVEKIDANHVM
jgi:hypothetical protein